MRAESWPEDPPIGLEETLRNLRNIPPFIEPRLWAVRQKDGPEIVAMGQVWVARTEDNQHLADFGISVLPEMRRQGIARRLLARVVEAARALDRRLLLTGTDSKVPAGEAFMNRLGAHKGLTAHTNQLDLHDLDRDLLRDWQKRARERAAGFTLGLWDGPYPEEALAEVVAMKQAINRAPRGSLEVEDATWTPERLRQEDASMVQRKVERWTMFVREAATGEIAGYTELFWNPERPETLHQGDTAVFEKFQNRGLGRWLKAAMMEKALRERPQVKRVRTGNADSNAPMLKINTEMGFKPYKSWTVWQVELDRVDDYLAGRR